MSVILHSVYVFVTPHAFLVGGCTMNVVGKIAASASNSCVSRVGSGRGGIVHGWDSECWQWGREGEYVQCVWVSSVPV